MSSDSGKKAPVGDAGAVLVGRQNEMKALDEALAAVRTQRATRIVTVIGAAGLGKSRLVHDFVERHRAENLRVYRGSARDSVTSFGIFARLLRARFGISKGMPPSAAKARVTSQVSAVLEDRKVDDVVYFLGQLLGIPFDDSPLTRAVREDPHELGLIRRAVFKAFLEADAMASTTCLVFEDLHFAHDESLSLLRYLLQYLAAPVLVVCVARPELLSRQEDWAEVGAERHRLLELQPLDDEDAEEMMRVLLSPCEGGAPQPLIESACAFAGGSPLLLEQMVRIYHDKGVLIDASKSPRETIWRVDLDKLEAVTLPLTIEDAINARLSALDAQERHMLEHAATMGSVFWSDALVVLSRTGCEAPELWGGMDAEIDDPGAGSVSMQGEDSFAIAAMLAELSEREYILRLPDSIFARSDEYVFKHNREREAILGRIGAATLRRYHQIIADWMEHQEAVHASEENLAMLAQHRERAGDGLRAGLGYLDAGDAARARYAVKRACEYYQRGLDLLGDGFVGRRIDALHHYGDVLQIAGRIDDALAAFREMLTLSYRLDLRRKGGAAHNRIGRLYRDMGSLDLAARHLQTAMALFKAEGDERGVASSIDDIGRLHWLKGEYEAALDALRDGLSRRRKLADRRSIALSLNNLGQALLDSGEFKQAMDAFEQALAIRREIGDLVGVVTTLNSLAKIAQDQRDFANALTLLQEALEGAEHIGDRNRTALILTNIGEAHYRSGNPAEAIRVLARAEELCDELGDKLGLAETLRALGKAYLLHGDLAKARDCIGRAVDLFAEVRSKVHLGSALRTLGEITAAGGWGSAHTRSAREYFARAATIFEQIGNDVELARTFKVYARFLLEGDGAYDPNVRREALHMNSRAEGIFSRLKITAGPIEAASISALGSEPPPANEEDEEEASS